MNKYIAITVTTDHDVLPIICYSVFKTFNWKLKRKGILRPKKFTYKIEEWIAII